MQDEVYIKKFTYVSKEKNTEPDEPKAIVWSNPEVYKT